MRSLLIFFLLLIFSSPLVVLISAFVNELLSTGWGPSFSGLFSVRFFLLLLKTIIYASTVSGISILLGGFAASLLAGVTNRSLRVLRWGFMVFIPLPAYINALSCMSVVDMLNKCCSLNLNFYGGGATGIAQVMNLFPLSTAILLVGFESIEQNKIDAARMFSGNGRVLFRVIIPLMKPVIIVAFGLGFIISTMDYSLPALLQYNTYAMELFLEFSYTNAPGRLFMVSLPLLFVAVLLFLPILKGVRQLAMHSTRSPVKIPVSIFTRILQVLALFTLFAQIAVHFFAIFTQISSFGSIFETLAQYHNELLISVQVALFATLLFLPLAFILGIYIARNNRTVLWFLLIMPLAIPTPLIASALIYLFNREWAGAIYNTLAMPVMAVGLRFTPIAIWIIAAQFRQIDPSLFSAADIYQRNPVSAWFRVKLPLLCFGITGAMSSIFLLSLGEVGATLMVIPPGQSTIAITLFNNLHSGLSHSIAVLSLLLCLVTMAFIGFIIIFPLMTKHITAKVGDK